MKNGLSIDVEEYFHVSAFESLIRQETWNTFESRVEKNIQEILKILDRFQTRSTLFVLGWVAEKHPGLIRSIQERGHEIACHGYAHKLIYQHSPDEFREDLRRSKQILEDILGEPVIGFRAPSYSITQDSLWAVDILIEEGFRYDSSIFPVHHDRYGIPQAPRFPHEMQRNGGKIMEFPLSTVRLPGFNFPVAGGGYLRLLPYPLIRWGIQRINDKEKMPAVVYFHTWEIDPDQPRQDVRLLTRLRHYMNIRQMENKLHRLLARFKFAPLREVLQLSN